MKFRSTKSAAASVDLSQAIANGIAPDGGLYVPQSFPRLDLTLKKLPELASDLLAPFFVGDRLEPKLREICDAVFNFPLELRWVESPPPVAVLELFHGPTAAFKDFGARFLAECLGAVPSSVSRTILVATSGDTGGAVAAAFFKRPGFKVVILYPQGKVSARQEKQLTAWGHNVRALAVRGDFDDCQRLAKEAFRDDDMQRAHHFTSANSINLGRLLPQMVYYAFAALTYIGKKNAPANFVIPSGNLGNAVACFWAKQMGLPIGKIVLATNANRSIPDYFAKPVWAPQPTVATLANAMDVGNASNMERLLDLLPDHTALALQSSAVSVTDAQISFTIREVYQRQGFAVCPHTATAFFAAENLNVENAVVVATAHPAKFDTIVEPLIGACVTVPDRLRAIIAAPGQFIEISPQLGSLRHELDSIGVAKILL